MKDRRYQEGPGIKAGDLELHPGIGGEIGYDSNWFLRSFKDDATLVNAAPANPPREGGVLRITPSFSVSTMGTQRQEGGATAVPTSRTITFRGSVSATYREFFGAEEIRKQRNVSGTAGARLDVNSGRPISFGVFAGYQRLIQPAVVQDPNLSFNRSDVNAGADITFTPGGGTLDIRAGYQIYGALFEESQGVPFTNIQHEISVRNRWRFRPRTALFHDTTLRFVTYPNADRALNYLDDSTPVRTRVGLTGLLTPRFGALLAAGYGATFFKDTQRLDQYDSINAQAEGTFYLSQTPGAGEPGQATLLLSTVTFGFLRDFQNSLLGNYYTSNKGYGRLEYWFGGKAVFTLDAFFEALGYPPIFYNTGAGPAPATGRDGQPIGEFTNYRIGAALFGEYRFTDSFGVNTTLDYQQMISDTQIPAGSVTTAGGGPPQAQFFDLNWRRFQAFIGARWFL
jgi:hypothetical protein